MGRRPELEPLEEERAGGGDDPGLADVELRDEAASAAEALGVLRPDQRKVVELAVMQGFTHQEVAAQTGLPLGTVKSHVRRGLDKVAGALRAARARRTGGGDLMSGHSEELLDLYAERATVGLSEEAQAELARLEREAGGAQAEASDYEAAAAAIQLAGLTRAEATAMPDSLRSRLERAAEQFEEARGLEPNPLRLLPQAKTPTLVGGSSRLWAGAAALLALVSGGLLFSLFQRTGDLSDVTEQLAGAQSQLDDLREPSLQERYDALASGDSLRWDFGPGNDATGTAISGDVVWSRSTREGYMRLSGLAVNDPTVEQYQLWILEDGREHPIDGGVFDITEAGEVLVPVRAPLNVRGNETLFAITVERPGGVVVSTKKRIAGAAAKPQ